MSSLSSPPQTNDFSPRYFNARAHLPPTPSPLRTSRNANLMPDTSRSLRRADDAGSLLSSSPLGKSGGEGWSGRDDENFQVGFGGVATTPVGKTLLNNSAMQEDDDDSSRQDAPLITPPDSSATSKARSQIFIPTNEARPIPPSPFTLSFEPQGFGPASSTIQTPASEWETRARSASPAAALARHAAAEREQKKTQFLDRIRRRRDDIRTEGYGEQVLRMDFVRERRVWEDAMRRKAALVEAQVGEEDEDMLEEEEEEDQISPTEEVSPGVDVDELVRFYEDEHAHHHHGADSGIADDEFLVDDPDDEEYERLFHEMEILSQSQRQSSSQSGSQAEQRPHHQPPLHVPGMVEQPPRSQRGQQEDFDANMDLS